MSINKGRHEEPIEEDVNETSHDLPGRLLFNNQPVAVFVCTNCLVIEQGIRSEQHYVYAASQNKQHPSIQILGQRLNNNPATKPQGHI